MPETACLQVDGVGGQQTAVLAVQEGTDVTGVDTAVFGSETGTEGEGASERGQEQGGHNWGQGKR